MLTKINDVAVFCGFVFFQSSSDFATWLLKCISLP